MATLTCPKCRGEMHSYERNGVTVEQCADCRGLFLDRGELERLATAEAQWFARSHVTSPSPPAPATVPGPGYGPRYDRDYKRDDDDDDDRRRYSGYGSGGYGHDGYKGRRKKSFLDDLFG